MSAYTQFQINKKEQKQTPAVKIVKHRVSTPTPAKGPGKRQSVDPDLAEAMGASPLPAKRQALAKSVKEARAAGAKQGVARQARATKQAGAKRATKQAEAQRAPLPIDDWVAQARPGLLAAESSDELVRVVLRSKQDFL